jgi:hypothetical protein
MREWGWWGVEGLRAPGRGSGPYRHSGRTVPETPVLLKTHSSGVSLGERPPCNPTLTAEGRCGAQPQAWICTKD